MRRLLKRFKVYITGTANKFQSPDRRGMWCGIGPSPISATPRSVRFNPLTGGACGAANDETDFATIEADRFQSPDRRGMWCGKIGGYGLFSGHPYSVSIP